MCFKKNVNAFARDPQKQWVNNLAGLINIKAQFKYFQRLRIAEMPGVHHIPWVSMSLSSTSQAKCEAYLPLPCIQMKTLFSAVDEFIFEHFTQIRSMHQLCFIQSRKSILGFYLDIKSNNLNNQNYKTYNCFPQTLHCHMISISKMYWLHILKNENFLKQNKIKLFSENLRKK